MSAPFGPDEQSHTAQHSEVSEHQDPINQDQSALDYNGDYIPEREFVLMPLFRRIGEVLGLRRREEPQYFESEPENHASETQQAQAEVHSQAETIRSFTGAGPLAPSLAPQAEHELQEDPLGRDLLDVESDLPEPVVPRQDTHLEEESQAAPFQSADNSQEAFEPIQTRFEAVEPTAQEYESAAEEPIAEAPTVTRRAEQGLAPELVQPRPTAQDVQELVAPLREAAAKISEAVAQAADWLRLKEEEILRRADLPAQKPLGQQEHKDQSPFFMPLEAHNLAASTPAEPEPALEQAKEVPAVLPEPAWQQRSADMEGAESKQQPTMIYRNQDHPAMRPRPQLVPPAPPLWKRINWAEEFTPKRVALLGGLVMAVLLVVGVSLARRPASSVLPEQQQTRSLEPHGVTVTTHPVSAAQAPTRQTRRGAPAPQPSPVRGQHHSQRAAEYDGGDPEVVTHYYSKKPSPVKQTTVAGVRHYSDM
ncbi:MAG TPA: hypothetical protein VM912_11575 [Terriglobales bacterium]|nr:hypothetical protein [Terriglobales bacterium]